MTEPAWVIKHVAERAEISESAAADFVDLAHHVVDKLVTEGISVLAPPLLIAFADDPVYERLRFLPVTMPGTWAPGSTAPSKSAQQRCTYRWTSSTSTPGMARSGSCCGCSRSLATSTARNVGGRC